jgi:hypothetical protein
MRASPLEAATHDRHARALAQSLAAGLDRDDARRFLGQLGFAVELPAAALDPVSSEPLDTRPMG